MRLSLNNNPVEDIEDSDTAADKSQEELGNDPDETPVEPKASAEEQTEGSPPLTAKSFSMESMQSVPLNSSKSTAGTGG